MNIHQENFYPLDVAQLFKVFTDKAYFKEFYSKGDGNFEFMECGERNGKFIIHVRRDIPLKKGADIPSLVKKFLGNVVVLHTIMEWENFQKNNIFRGTYRFSVDGVPIDVSGSMRLDPVDGGCVHRMDVNISCSIPLVGGKIAAMAGERAEKILQKDYAKTTAYLQDVGLINV